MLELSYSHNKFSLHEGYSVQFVLQIFQGIQLLLTLEAVVYNELFLGLVDSYSYKWGGQIVKTPIEV